MLPSLFKTSAMAEDSTNCTNPCLKEVAKTLKEKNSSFITLNFLPFLMIFHNLLPPMIQQTSKSKIFSSTLYLVIMNYVPIRRQLQI